MKIANVKTNDIEESIIASKYPMAIDVSKCTSEITNTTNALASCEKGTGHDQFLTGITVSFDLTCSNKMWVEMERYRFVNFVSSQSTMHRASKFNIKSQCNGYVDKRIIDVVEDLKNQYNENSTPENYLKLLYNIPSGFELTARLTTNYRALKTVYSQRKEHRLPEWRAFCKWIETLPHSELIIGKKFENKKTPYTVNKEKIL